MRAAELTEADWAAIDRGLRLPFLEKHEPQDIDEGLEFYWRCWQEVGHGRSSGFGAGGLRFADLRSWLDERCVYRREDRDMCIDIVLRLDADYLAELSAKIDRESGGGGFKVKSQTHTRRA